MNQKGEITLINCLLILCLTSIVLISALELRNSFKLLERRTHLFLCVKETKGEFHEFMTFMGRTNWGIRNINRVSLIMLFIPGAQGMALDAQKVKKYLQYAQNTRIVSYLKTLKDLKKKQCPLDPRMFITPFEINRDSDGALKLKDDEWTYGYFLRPYFLSIKVTATGWENIHPKIQYVSEEKAARLSSLLSSL